MASLAVMSPSKMCIRDSLYCRGIAARRHLDTFGFWFLIACLFPGFEADGEVGSIIIAVSYTHLHPTIDIVGAYATKIDECGNNLEEVIKAVSYTHLDVYKRQIIDWRG